MRGILKILVIEISCIIGNFDWERKKEQRIRLDIEIETDFGSCYGMSNTSKTVDWGDATREAEEILKKGRYYLAETACVDIAKRILKRPAALAVTVRLAKLEAVKNAQQVCAELRLAKKK